MHKTLNVWYVWWIKVCMELCVKHAIYIHVIHKVTQWERFSSVHKYL